MTPPRLTRARPPITSAAVILVALLVVGALASSRGHTQVAPGPPRYQLQPDVVGDLKTRLFWQRLVPVGVFSLAAAEQYCADLQLANQSDWRLPSMQELQTVVDESRANPAIDPVVFPATPGEGFWSATRWAGTPQLAWRVDFERGSAAYDTATISYRVRCVRWQQ